MNVHHRCLHVTVKPGRSSPLSFTSALNNHHPSKCSLQTKLARFFLQGWGLIDLPLRAFNEGLPRPRVARAQETNRLPTFHLSSPPSLSRGVARLSFTARIERYVCSLQACLFSLQGWRLTDLPLRASNEGSPRPRVARAQKIIRLHPILCSASKKDGPATPLPS
jgi:hypothetical protein